MIILSFHEDTRKPLRSKKMTNSSYLPQMTLNPKNKGSLFSSTFKVEDNKVLLFSWSEVILVSYDNFVVSPISLLSRLLSKHKKVWHCEENACVILILRILTWVCTYPTMVERTEHTDIFWKNHDTLGDSRNAVMHSHDPETWYMG